MNKNNKTIIGVISVIVIVAMGIGIFMMINRKEVDPFKTIKINKVGIIEYGSDIDLIDMYTDAQSVDEFFKKHDTATIAINDVDTKNEVTKFTDEFTVEMLTEEIAKEDFNIETIKDKVVLHTAKVVVKIDDKEYTQDVNYIVVDTQMPEITGIEDRYTITQGDELTIDAKGNDKVDGELEIKFDKDINVNEVGEQTIKATVEDKNGNVTEKEFKVVVEEKVEELIETPPTTNPGNTINNNTNSNSNNTANKPSTGNTDGSTQKPTETPKPVEPETPKRPGPNPPTSNHIFYKDFGDINSCAANIDSLKKANRETWKSNYCDDHGYMYYTPRN